MSKLCALVVGHKKRSPGASNKATGLTEFDYNDQLAREIERAVAGVEVQRVYRRTYRQLPGDINELGPHFIISLHCNAYNGQASGTEVLYYHRSTRGQQLAGILQTRLAAALALPDRGIKSRTSEDRGGTLLRYTHAPCVIAEPFFIDNDKDLKRAQKRREQLVQAYAGAIEQIAAVI